MNPSFDSNKQDVSNEQSTSTVISKNKNLEFVSIPAISNSSMLRIETQNTC